VAVLARHARQPLRGPTFARLRLAARRPAPSASLRLGRRVGVAHARPQQHQAAQPTEAVLAHQLLREAEADHAVFEARGHERGLRLQPLGEEQDLVPGRARGLVLVHGDRRVAVSGPGEQRIVVGARGLRDARERYPLRVEDPLRCLAPRARHARGEGEPQPGQRARSLDVDILRLHGGHLPAHRVSLYRRMSAISRAPEVDALAQRYRTVRAASLALAEPLSAEDCALQSMPDASPTKWHLAHTSWYFETFALEPALPGYRPFEPAFRLLFNSYYNGVGPQYARPQRGLLARPSLPAVLPYREHVARHLLRLLEDDKLDSALRDVILLGTHHEQQHQELILTDLLHLFAQNPLAPVYREPAARPVHGAAAAPVRFVAIPGGLREVG